MNNSQNCLSDDMLLAVVASSDKAKAVYSSGDLHIGFVSDSMLKIWGKSRSVIGKRLDQAIPEMEGQPFTQLLKDVWKTGRTYNASDIPAQIEVDGVLRTFYFDIEYRPFKDDQNRVYCILHTATDVTTRPNAQDTALEKQQAIEKLNQDLQVINEEYQATNEELGAINEEYLATNEELNRANEEIKRSKSKLAKSEELMRFAIDAANVGTWYINAATREFVPSTRLKELFGYREEEIMPYEAAVNQITEDYRTKVTTAVEYAIAKGEAYDIEYSITGFNDNRLRWVRAFGKLYLDRHGTPNHFSGVMIDVTEQKRKRQLIEESEQRFRALAEGSEVMISVNDINGNVEYVNQAWLNLTGRTQKEMRESSWGNFVHPDDQKSLLAEFADGIRSRKPFTLEFRMMNGENEPRWIYTKVNPRISAEGGYIGTISSSIDLTERIAQQQQVEEMNIRLQIALDAGSFGSTEVELATGKMLATDQFKRCYGRNPEQDFTYPQLFEAILPKYHEEVKQRVAFAMENQSVYEAEYEVFWPDGTIHWISAHGRARYDNKGKATKMVGIVSDITESKRDEQRKNDFIGMVSHELKTPLTSINGYVQIMQKKVHELENPIYAQALEKTALQVGKMTSLINGFLNISRLESGKIHLNLQRFDMEIAIEEVINDLQLVFGSHEIVFDKCKAVYVNVDRDKIGQVVNNLLTNAIKYSPNKSRIEVDCKEEEGIVKVSIRDYGMGIKSIDQEKLFERFYRVEGDQMKAISGFGIGLYLSAEIIERHNGKIGVASKVGEGSIFWFTLPLQNKDDVPIFDII